MERNLVRLHLPPGNTGYTYSHSSSYSPSLLDREREQGVALKPPVMSRRSLRIHTTSSPAAPYGEDSLLDGSLPYGHASFSQRDAKGLKTTKSRRSQQLLSVSCSQSLLHPRQLTPRKPSSQSLLNSSLLSVASSTPMLSSSLLDESCIQETTLVDSGWGLDQDFDPQESTFHAQDSTVLTNSTLLNSTLTASRASHCPHHPGQTQGSMANGHYCKDCALHSDRMEALTTTPRRTSSSSSSGGVQSGASECGLASSPPSIIYCRKKSRKTGVLVSMWDSGVRVSRGAAAFVAYLLTLLYHSVLLRIHQYGKGVVRSVLSSSLLYGRRAAASTVSVLSLALQASQAALFSRHSRAKTKADVGSEKVVNGAHSSYCGSMNVKELGTDSRKRLHGSLCDDCKQQMESHTLTSSSSSSWSSVAYYWLGLLWSATAYTGSSVLWLAQRAASASRAVSQRLLSAVWLPTRFPGKAASRVSRWLERGWYHLVTFMSLLKVFLLQHCLPRLPRLLLILLLPLLLLFSLWWFGPSSLFSALPAVNMSDWRTALPFTGLPSLSSLYAFSSTHSQAAGSPVEEAADIQAYREPPYSPPPAAEDGAAVSVDPERLLRVEQSLSQLWGRVEGGGRRAEQKHGEMLRLYQTLEQLLHSASDQESMEPWVAGLLDHRLDKLRGLMEEERALRVQTQQQYVTRQQSQASHLAEMELLLQTMAAKTEEIQRRQEAAATVTPTDTSTDATLPAPISVGVDRESHDALLAEVVRLEAALGGVRQDLQGLMGCQDTCGQLDGLQETISAQVSAQVSRQVSSQVREDLRALFYGNQLATTTTTGSESSADPVDLPDSLLQWLTERYVSAAGLQASLASLELSILQNVSLQLERHSGEETPCAKTVSQTVAHTMGAAGAVVTEEEVQLIVKNALRLYSQDQTGLADFALESGGGSVLSTRCSETYGTKTALMSLFGLPLWYFSQSPRVVIQPDVHPGNCWAFKGSHGYLVIRLSMRIHPTAFTVEHIPRALAPSGSLRSAPRDFTVYGLDNESQEHGKLLGSYTYEQDGEAVQTYHVSEQNDKAFQIIEVQVQSNWGHEEYTCMYRFRVHGTPSSN